MVSNCPSRARGHALVEMLLVAAALLPLLVLIPALGKLQDIAHAARMASRAVAFDAAWHHDRSSGWTDPQQLAQQIRARHFARDAGPLRAGQEPGEGSGSWAPPHWTQPDGTSWIRDPQSIRIGFGPNASHEPADGWSDVGDSRPFELQPLAGAARLGLPARGTFTGRVEVPLARWAEGIRLWQPFDRLDLTLAAETSVLIDGWVARSPAEVEQRVSSASPVPPGLRDAARGLAGLGVTALELGRLPPPRIGDLEAWRDVVPQDRLRLGEDR